MTCTNDPSGGFGLTFTDGEDLLETVPVSADGVATYTATFDTVGTYTVTAVYAGNGECFSSNGTTTVEVSESPTPPTPPATPATPATRCGCGGQHINIYQG